MAEMISISAEGRSALGTRVSRRYRKAGKIPAVLTRRGEQPVHLLVKSDEFARLLKKHVRILTLQHPGGGDKVFVREVQYDHLDEHPIHIDFTRVAADELLTLTVPLVLKGKPIGVVEEAGVLDQYVKELRVQCLPDAIPDRIEADVTALKKDVNFMVKDLKAPAGVTILHDPDLVVAVVQEHKVEEVVPAAAAVPGPLEPEVIKKEKGEEEAEEGADKKEAPKKEAAAKEEAPKKDAGGKKEKK